VSGEYDRADDYYADQENAELCGGDDYTGPRSIADTLEELKELYPAIPRALHAFATGATSSTAVDDLRYDLISPVGLEAIARVMAKRARIHGEHNWLKGIAVHDNICHAIHHFYRYLSGDRSEDHLGNATARGLMAIHSDKMWPHLNAGHLCGPGCTPPESPITEVEF
jgi:dATP/dGTP diphosphohydrolase, N-terminal